MIPLKHILPMEEPKRRLLDLETYLPKASSPLVYDFGRYLAHCLSSPKTSPMGFALTCELAICDLAMGVSHPEISHRLSGQPVGLYDHLHHEIPAISDAIFPEEFAAAVKSYLDQFEHMIP